MYHLGLMTDFRDVIFEDKAEGTSGNVEDPQDNNLPFRIWVVVVPLSGFWKWRHIWGPYFYFVNEGNNKACISVVENPKVYLMSCSEDLCDTLCPKVLYDSPEFWYFPYLVEGTQYNYFLAIVDI